MKKLWLMFFVLSVLFSCKKDKVEYISNSDIEGKWVQNELIKGTHEGVEYYFEFCGNDFKLKMDFVTDAISPEDTCSSGSWSEYVTGVFEVDKNILIADGYYTDSLYSRKTHGCFNIGEFNESYKLRMEDPLVLILQKDDSSNEFTLNLEAKVACNEVEP